MTSPLPPGSVIGILGGGQLGRMTALAAANLGYQAYVYCLNKDDPAAQVCARSIVGQYDDEDALRSFAAMCDVITLEFENIPTETLQFLENIISVRPHHKVLAVTQSRLEEKGFAKESGFETASYQAVRSISDLRQATKEIGCPSILKTNRFGYDGKGQVRIEEDTDLVEAWESLQTDEAILEGFVEFDKEVSIIVARSSIGEIKMFPVTENIHVNHVLSESIVPTTVAPEVLSEVEKKLVKLVEKMDLNGLLAIEFFVSKSGTFLVNEMAPRPHNSGHWTMDGCMTSQFEQLVRAVCGLPLGSTKALGKVKMKNILGPDDKNWEAYIKDAHAKLHLYGKSDSKPGRKMGHVTYLELDQ